MSLDNYSNDPNNKCFYEAIWNGLICTKSYLIEKYKLTEMTDFYKLIVNGINGYPKLFENNNVKKFLSTAKKKYRPIYDHCIEFKEKLEKNEDGVWEIMQILASLYLEINIVIKEDHRDNISEDSIKDKNNRLADIIKACKIKPSGTLEIVYTKNHVEYSPKTNEEEIFNREKRKLNRNKAIFEEKNDMEYILMEHDDDDDDDLFQMEDLLDLQKSFNIPIIS